MLPLLADTITPLIGSSFAYLFVLNAAIGLLEGKLLKRWFGGGRRAVWWMIAANYLSAWVGWFAVIWLLGPRIGAMLGPRPIERINSIALLIVGVCFFVTILAETGFVYLASLTAKRSWLKTLVASVTVNTISYLLICLWFMWQSYSLPLNAHVTSIANLGRLPAGRLYWVDQTGQIMAEEFDKGMTPKVVGRVMQTDFVRPYQLQINSTQGTKRARMEIRYSTIVYNDRPTPAGAVPPDDSVVIADVGPTDAFPEGY